MQDFAAVAGLVSQCPQILTLQCGSQTQPDSHTAEGRGSEDKL